MKLLYGKEAKHKIKDGIDKLADIVKVTLGGKGKNVIYEDYLGKIHIINDGTTIANQVEIPDEIENAGASLAKQVAAKTNEQAGDGTTTSIVLLQEFLSQMEEIKNKDSRGLREEIKLEVDKVLKKLDEMKKKVSGKDIERIAYISSLNQSIALDVARTVKKVGKDGVINIEDSRTFGISTEVVNGVRIDNGYVTNMMVTDETTQKAELTDIPVLLSRKKITTLADILPILDALSKENNRQIAIFCEDVSDEVLSFLLVNKLQGKFLSVVVKTRDLDDIEIVTGAKIITPQNDLKFSAENLGKAGKVSVSRYTATVMDGKEDPDVIGGKIDELKEREKNTEVGYEKEHLKTRIAKLTGGVAVMKIGGENDQETNELKLKLEDAVNAVKAAQEEGVVEGGGLALLRATVVTSETEAGKLVERVISKPFYQILENAEVLEEVVDNINGVEIDKIKKAYNVVSGKYENFFETGVIDPVKVTKSAVRNAFAMGMQILTAEAAIINKVEEKK